MLLLTLLSATLAVATAVGFVLKFTAPRAHLETPVSAASRIPAPVLAAQQWLSMNLPYTARVIADDAVRAVLVSSGFPPHAVARAGKVVACPADSFVVITRTLQMLATATAPLGRCVQSALPIAVFGNGPTAVRIAQVSPAGSAALSSRRRLDAQERTRAGMALLRNPSVRASAAVRAQLRAGGLDLRAVTVVAAIARHTVVQITAVTGVAAELAAGLPARTVALTLTDAAPLPAVLAGLSAPFRPSATVHVGPVSVRLVWPFTTATIPR